MPKQTEIWKPVMGFENRYEVSNYGNVRAIFYGNHGAFKPGRILKPTTMPNGYLQVGLYRADMSYSRRSVHSLVLEAFKGLRPDGFVSRHMDGVRSNNTSDNLEWGTRAQNYDDSRRHGTNCEGERNGFSVLTDEQVIQIRKLRGEGMTYVALGKMFETHWSNTWLICKGRTWKTSLVNSP